MSWPLFWQVVILSILWWFMISTTISVLRNPRKTDE